MFVMFWSPALNEIESLCKFTALAAGLLVSCATLACIQRPSLCKAARNYCSGLLVALTHLSATAGMKCTADLVLLPLQGHGHLCSLPQDPWQSPLLQNRNSHLLISKHQTVFLLRCSTW